MSDYDMVNAPEHYTRLNPEPIEVILKWKLDFCPASALKYMARAGFKPGADAVQDYKKAIRFLELQIKWLESQ